MHRIPIRWKEGIIFIALLLAMGMTVFAETAVPVEYQHVWYTNVEGADDTFYYILTAKSDGAPLPAGSRPDGYIWRVDAEEGSFSKEGEILKWTLDGIREWKIPFTKAGDYVYEFKALVERPVRNYYYEPRVYTITVTVDEKLSVSKMSISGSDDKKYEKLEMDPHYLADGSGSGKTDGSGSGKTDDSGSGKTDGSGSGGSQKEDDSWSGGSGKIDNSGSGGSSKKTSSESSDEDSERKGSSRVTTGDQTPLGLIVGLFVIAACAVVLLLIAKRKNREETEELEKAAEEKRREDRED